jgi:serine/threonine-protein kinase
VIVDHPKLIAGRYRIDSPLGTGGMGTVFAGHDLRLDRPVAVKVLREELHRDAALRRRFEREARAAARLSHPHAVAIYDIGEDEAHDTFIVMERLSGRTLADELDDGPLDERRLRAIAMGVLDALDAAHAEGIVHRDVKPGNILLVDDGEVKIGDFGIATMLDASDRITVVPLGTPAYTAPERLRGFAATERSDLYSLAVVLYEAAAGERPFTGDAPGAIADAVVAGVHVPLGRRRPDLSDAFVAAVERALALDPADRFARADEMRTAIATPTSATVPVTVPVRASRPPTAPAPATAPATATLPAPVRPRLAPTTRAARTLPRAGVVRVVVALVAGVVLVVGVVFLVARGDSSGPVPRSPRPATSAPVPSPLARALDRLEQATQP